MTKRFAAILAMMAGLGAATLEAGFRSPESLVRNIYAYYGQGAPELSNGLPRDPAITQQFFDRSLQRPGTRPKASLTISWCRVRRGSSAPSR